MSSVIECWILFIFFYNKILISLTLVVVDVSKYSVD